LITELEKKKEIYRLLRIKKILRARKHFWEFEKVINPTAFQEEYTYLIILAICLQSFYTDQPVSHFSPVPIEHHRKIDLDGGSVDVIMEEQEGGTFFQVDLRGTDILIIECPPRHKKSYSLINFEDWILGRQPDQIIITCSHNIKIANRMSQFVRNGISGTRLRSDQIIYSDIFPGTVLKYGQKAKEEWAIEGQHISYVAGGILSGITSMGGNLIIFDDLIKGALEAFNENHLEKVWDSLTGTWLSRLEKPRKQVYVMTPWAKGDPSDKIQEGSADSGEVVKLLNLKAWSEKQGMLCDDVLDSRANNILKSRLNPMIYSANYLSIRLDMIGRLYTEFKTYTPNELPTKFEEVFSYIDTADEGKDFLDAGIVGIIRDKDEFGTTIKKAYILDIYDTQDGMEITEPMTAKFLVRNHKQSHMNVKIESNNGGRGFSRNVQRILKTEYEQKSSGISITWFHQSENKQARIISESNTVMKYIYFPHDWETRWPEFHKKMTRYMKEGKNEFDDHADMITGIAEHINTERTSLDFYLGNA